MCIHASICISIRTFIHASIHMHIHMSIHGNPSSSTPSSHAYTHVSCLYTYLHTCLCTHLYACPYTSMHRYSELKHAFETMHRKHLQGRSQAATAHDVQVAHFGHYSISIQNGILVYCVFLVVIASSIFIFSKRHSCLLCLLSWHRILVAM